MASDVSMDYGTVQKIADTFKTGADTLNKVNQALEAVEAILTATAFIGLVGGAAAAEIENIRQNVSKVANICTTLDNDTVGAIKAIRDGDYSGSQRFV